MSNMDIWNKGKDVPEYAKERIGAGRMSGKTSVKPQWRYLTLTEIFGPCGIGWKYDIVDVDTYENKAQNEVVVNVRINFYYRDQNAEDPTKWSAAIPAVGGAKIVTMESKGEYVDDEAVKKALTDALSVACKMIGIAADVYMGGGHGDGNKYQTQPAQPAIPAPQAPQKEQAQQPLPWQNQQQSVQSEQQDSKQIGTVEAVSIKEGVGAKGPWKRYGVKIGEQWFGTFDETLGQSAETMKGFPVEFVGIQQGQHFNLKSISLLGTQAAPHGQDNDLPF